MCQDDGLANAQRPGVGLLLSCDQAEERGLAGAVGTDDADDASRGQAEVESLEEEIVAVGLAQPLGLDDHVTEPRAGGNVDLVALAPRLGVGGEQALVGGDALAAVALAQVRGHLHPLELVLQRPRPARRGFVLLGEHAQLLVEPGGVVTFPGDAFAAVELQDPAGDLVEEVAVVGDGDHRAGVLAQEALEPGDGFGV